MPFAATVAAGTLRSTSASAQPFLHRWTPEGVTVEAEFTGAHLLHLATAGCVLNDLYPEAAAQGIVLKGVRVRAEGDFEPDTWRSTGISYVVEVDSAANPEQIADLLQHVDEVAEIPRAIRSGAMVRREDQPAE